jgi:Rrf2 family protein
MKEAQMPVNTKTEYALRALIEMADSEREAISARHICDRQNLPKKYVEHLLSGLKQAGLITSSSGSRGGYVLSRKAPEITLQMVMDAVDDHSMDPACGHNRDEFCLGATCGLNAIFGRISCDMRKLLSKYTLDDFYSSYKQALPKEEK